MSSEESVPIAKRWEDRVVGIDMVQSDWLKTVEGMDAPQSDEVYLKKNGERRGEERKISLNRRQRKLRLLYQHHLRLPASGKLIRHRDCDVSFKEEFTGTPVLKI